MDITLSPSNTREFVTQPHVYARELLHAFESFESKIKVLSLDCFDTLLWRKTTTPFDVFFDMQHRPAFSSLGLTATLRVMSEDKARAANYIKQGSMEVKLRDIYQSAYPEITKQQINALATDELAAEMDACYAFPAVVELIRLAHAKNKKIIIVSDTYFSELQLRFLLASKLPEDAMAAIDKVFCSCEYGKSKSFGLFKNVIEELDVATQSILHVGDNSVADLHVASAYRMNALQLMHLDEKMEKLQDMQVWSGIFVDQEIRYSRPHFSPFHGLFAATDFSEDKPETLIGYASAGPIMFAFAKFLETEIAALKNAGKPVKVLFLMRDGHLPSLACEALMGDQVGWRVRISRFATFASSFRNKNDLDSYLADVVHAKHFDAICNQLLLPETIASTLIQEISQKEDPVSEFLLLIYQDDIQQLIFQNSTSYRKRLMRYLQKEVGFEKNDTLMFVDLGYTGTTQQKLAPIFRDELGVEVVGCYLIALPTPGAELSRKGLLDSSCCDSRTLTMLTNYIAMVEQICTENQNSVVDYDEQGNPIFTDTFIGQQQHIKLGVIQAECVRFIYDAENFLHTTKLTLDLRILRDMALAELVRFIFLPTMSETHYLKTFKFDVNLGTKNILDMFDLEKGVTNLRHRGMFFMERNIENARTNYPAELRAASLPHSFLLMSIERFKGKIGIQDTSLRRELLSIIIMMGAKSSCDRVEAIPTFDGYYALMIPVGKGEFQVGVQFGMNYRWVEVECAQLIKSSALCANNESEYTEDAKAYLIPNGMTEKDTNLYECASETALLAFIPPKSFADENHILRIIFRPIVRVI